MPTTSATASGPTSDSPRQIVVSFEYAVTVDPEQVDANGNLTEEGREAAYETLMEGLGDRSGDWYPRYVVEPDNDFGDVLREVLLCISQRHDLSPIVVFDRAKEMLDEDDTWKAFLGVIVDQIDTELQRNELWPQREEQEVPSEF